jgi:hypothetical protein
LEDTIPIEMMEDENKFTQWQILLFNLQKTRKNNTILITYFVLKLMPKVASE